MPDTQPSAYRGRFAPSPTGPLHFGSLVAAVGSRLEARTHGGAWLLRLEDVDAPRTVAGAADAIYRSLEAHGCTWDGELVIQQERLAAYRAALERLLAQGDAYPCACTRAAIAAHGLLACDGAPRYPGTCRNGLAAGEEARAWRLRVPAAEISFVDGLQGPCRQQLERDVGDFVLRRADGQFAYQLAVVVDDGWQGITDVVRGADLLDSTARQIYLQQRLGLPTPRYLHLPVATNAAGEKLSKQTLAPALDDRQAAANLVAALQFLHQPIPAELAQADVPTVWQWAEAHWSLAALPRQRGVPVAS